MGDVQDVYDKHGHYLGKGRNVNSGGGCFTGLAFWIMVAVLIVIGVVSIFQGLAAAIGNYVFSPYHVFTTDPNDAVRTAVRNYVGSGKYAGLFETDAALNKNDPHFSNVTLDPELGGYPGKAYTVNQASTSYWFEFDNVGIQRQGHCLLIAYIKPTPGVSHTVYALVKGYQDQQRAYAFRIKPGQDSGSADIGIPASDQYSYTVYIQGDVGTPFEAIVVDRSEQESSSSSTSAQATPTPIRLASKYSGTLNDSGYDPPVRHQVALEIAKTKTNGSFEGMWYDSVDYGSGFGATIYVYSVQGVSVQFNQTNRFSQIDSVKVQVLYQQVGESGALLQFTIRSVISVTNGSVEDAGRQNGNDFYGVLTGRSVQGVWFVNSDTNVNESSGTFQLTASRSATAQPTPKPFIQNLPLHLAGTLYQDQDSSSYQVRLEVTKQNADGSFEGKWFIFVYQSDEDVLVHGVFVPMNESNRFGQINQDRVRQLQQEYGSNGTLLWFTGTSSDIGQDITVGVEYYGLLQTNNSVKGIWFLPTSNTAGGTFQLAS